MALDPLKPPDDIRVIAIIYDTKMNKVDLQGHINNEKLATWLIKKGLRTLKEYHKSQKQVDSKKE